MGNGAIIHVALVAAVASIVAIPAWAQEDPILVTVGGNVTWNSNVFALADSADPQAVLGTSSKSDRITSGVVGLRANRAVGLQRFALDASVTSVRYARFERLNFDPVQYRGTWNWRVTPGVGGVLSADRNETVVNSASAASVAQRTVRIGENRSASVEAAIFGGWHLVGALREEQRRDSPTIREEAGYKSTGGEAGIRYTATSGSTVAMQRRMSEGTYLGRAALTTDLLDQGFKRNETELLVNWVLSGRSSFNGRIASIDYHSKSFEQRSFEGHAGSLGYRWTATDRLLVSVDARRDLAPFQGEFSSYRKEDRLSLGLAWTIAARTLARASLARSRSTFHQPPVPQLREPRRDAETMADLGLEWRVLRNVSLNASVQRVRRTSTEDFARYGSSIASLGASLAF